MNTDNISIQLVIFDAIKQSINTEQLGEFTIDTPFDKIGLNSITFINMIVVLEEQYKFEFDDEKLLSTAFPTIRALIEYVEAKVLSVESTVLLAEGCVKK